MSGLPAAATSVGNQSRAEKMPFWTVPGLTWPGQRMMHGARKPPSITVPLVPLNGVMPPSGQVKTSAPLSVVKTDDGVVGLADVVQVLQEGADAVVDLRHAGFLETVVGLAVHQRLILRRQERPDVHARRVVPDEERLAVRLGLVHEVGGSLDQHFVEGAHVVFGLRRDVVHVRHVGHVRVGRQRALIDDPLLADLAPTRLLGRVVRVGRPAVDQVARADFVAVGLIIRKRVPVGVRHRVEVIQVAEELIEAMQCRQVLVQIAEMVLAELAGGIALGL